MDGVAGRTVHLVYLALCVLLYRHGIVEGKDDVMVLLELPGGQVACNKQGGGLAIHSVSVESEGVGRAARASIVVKTTSSTPVNIYWADITAWLPAEGHPNYTITQRTWTDDKYTMLQSTIELKKMLLSELSYYYDYEEEHIVYYLPMSADVSSADGEFIYHQTLDIPEKTASENHSETRFRVLERPETAVHYTDGAKVHLQWRFLSRDENVFTLWRTVFQSPTEHHDLDYADHMLYSEGFPDDVISFDNINITKEVRQLGKLFLVTVTLTIDQAVDDDEALYVLFIKSKKFLPWDETLNLRLSTRVLMENVTSLLHDDVALAISHCDGDNVAVVEDAAYVSLNKSVENCVKCEAYGNQVRDLVYTKGRYLVQASEDNALVYSNYYPETKSILYTFRVPNKLGGDTGEFYCRAILENNKVVSRKFHVAWTEPVTLNAVIVSVNQTEAEIKCTASGKPRPEITIWRCVGKSFCKLKKVGTQPGFQMNVTSDDVTTIGFVSMRMPAAELKREAILCSASNRFDSQEEWLLFDDRIQIEEAELENDPGETAEEEIVNDQENNPNEANLEVNQNEAEEMEAMDVVGDGNALNDNAGLESGDGFDIVNDHGNSDGKDRSDVDGAARLVADGGTRPDVTNDQYDQSINEVDKDGSTPVEQADDGGNYPDVVQHGGIGGDFFAYAPSGDGDRPIQQNDA